MPLNKAGAHTVLVAFNLTQTLGFYRATWEYTAQNWGIDWLVHSETPWGVLVQGETVCEHMCMCVPLCVSKKKEECRNTVKRQTWPQLAARQWNQKTECESRDCWVKELILWARKQLLICLRFHMLRKNLKIVFKKTGWYHKFIWLLH